MDTILNISDAANLAMHAMAYIALRGDNENLPVGIIADELRVSEAYLSKVMQRLSKVGLVVSQRGPSGGFVLNRPAKNISLIEILEAVDGPIFNHNCVLGRKRCERGGCALGDLFSHVTYQVQSFMRSRNLSDMLGSEQAHSSYLAGLGGAGKRRSRATKPAKRKR
jgi:Rrf2 family protein